MDFTQLIGFAGGLLILALCGIYATVTVVLLARPDRLPKGLILSSVLVFVMAVLDTLLRGYAGITDNIEVIPYSRLLGGLKAVPMLWFTVELVRFLRGKG